MMDWFIFVFDERNVIRAARPVGRVGGSTVVECSIQSFREHFVSALLRILPFSTFDGFAWKQGAGHK